MLILPKGYRERERGFIINPYAFGGGGGATDPYWANVVLLIPCEGTHGSTTIPDVSSSAHTVTVISGSSLSTAIKPSGAVSSCRFQTSGGGLTVPDHANFDFVSGDFTLETYFYMDGAGAVFPILFNKKNGTNFSPFQMLAGNADTQMFMRASNDGATYGASQVSGGTPFALSTWVHLAYGRTGTTFYSWLDGATLVATTTMSGALTTNSDLVCIGHSQGGTNLLSGYMAGIRFTKGVNRYTAGFTPPAFPFPTS